MADLIVANLRSEERDGTSRVSADVDGHEMFFESGDARLVAAPEAFAASLLHLAADTGRRLVLDRGLDPRWERGIARLLPVWAGWWGTPAASADVLAAPRRRPRLPRRRAPGVGLCFSLGVDSFHTLLRSGRRIDVLVMAAGHDIPLADRPRMAAAEASLRSVGRALGARVVLVATNLRDHPSARQLNWPRAHGGALAAIGHVCSGLLGELLISATKPVFADRPWGSHFRTDGYWSGSRLKVTHVGAQRRRNDKIAQLVHEPMVRRHLRVCWENRRPAGNCGACEKCVRTMLVLHALGQLEDFTAFPRDRPLAAAVDGVPDVIDDLFEPYRELAPRLPDPAVRAAVERLLERSAASGGA